MVDVEILDDFPLNYQNHIKSMIEGMPFELCDITQWELIKQFTHTFYHGRDNIKTNYCDRFIELFKELPEFKTHNLIRGKINITLPYKKRYSLSPHIDFPHPNAISYLYYVEDSDGPTVIWNKRYSEEPVDKPFLPWWLKKIKVQPKQGRLVKLPSDILHSGNVPYNYNSRVVLSLLFAPKFIRF